MAGTEQIEISRPVDLKTIEEWLKDIRIENKRQKKAVARDMMTTVEAGAFVKEHFGIEFTPKHIRSMLRSMGFRHAKPYDIDYRRPADAETVLKKRLESTLDTLIKMDFVWVSQTNPPRG